MQIHYMMCMCRLCEPQMLQHVSENECGRVYGKHILEKNATAFSYAATQFA